MYVYMCEEYFFFYTRLESFSYTKIYSNKYIQTHNWVADISSENISVESRGFLHIWDSNCNMIQLS